MFKEQKRKMKKIKYGIKSIVIIFIFFFQFYPVFPNSTKELYHAIENNKLQKVKDLLDSGVNIYDDRKNIHNKTPLHLACQSGYYEIVKLLIDRGVRVNVHDKYQRTALHYAVDNYSPKYYLPHQISQKAKRKKEAKNRLKIVKLLLKHKAEIDSKSDFEETALLLSSQYWPDIAVYLIDNGADVNLKNGYGSSAINYAASNAYEKLFFKLIENKADYTTQSNQNETLLHKACVGGSLKIVQFLLSKDFSINEKTGYLKTPLHFAVQYSQLPITKLLIEKGAKLNEKDGDQKTPLHYAAYRGYNDGIWMDKRSPKQIQKDRLECVKLLIDKGTNINALDKYKRNPLYYFVSNTEDIALFLLDKKADFNQKDIYNETPLNIAIYNANLNIVKKILKNGGKIEINKSFNNKQNWLHYLSNSYIEEGKLILMIQFLIMQGVDLNKRDVNGVSPFHIAASKNKIALCRFYIKNGLDINLQDNHGQTALSYNLQTARSLKAVKFFLEKKANFQVKDKSNNNLIHIISNSFYSINDDQVIFKELLKQKVNVNELNSNHDSPLHLAVTKNKRDFVRKLLNEKARLNVINKEGKTPLDYCSDNTIRKLLRNAGAKKSIEFSIDDKEYISMMDILLSLGFQESGQIDAPDFQVTDLNGKTLSSKDLNGKIVFVNFWASWCSPCIYEMPFISSLEEKINDDNFIILAITREDQAQISNFVKEKNIKVPVYIGSVSYKFYVKALPTTFIIDFKGRIIAHYIGSTKWDDPKYIKAFKELLQIAKNKK